MFHQMPVTFFDVAASFTEQQWSRLETWKKELYQNVMKELHGALTTLGYKIENPEILFKIKNADDTCVRIDVNSKEKENIDSKDLPDIVVRIKEETSLPCTTEEQSVKVNQNVDSPAQSFPVITSATSLCIKEEQPRTEVPACKSVTVSQEDIGGQNPILVKTEEESYSIDHYNSGFVKSDRSAAGPVEIKQEPEPTSDDDNNFSNIIPVVVKQEDGDSFSHKIEEAEPIGYYRLCDRANSEGTQQGTTSNMVIVPKRSKLTSEANEDQLSVEVIATKRAKLMHQLEGMTQSVREQPSFIYDPVSDVQEDDDQISEAHLRSANTAWCKCHHCCVLPTKEESTCCREVPNLNKLLGSDCVCIINHPVFHQICLDNDRLELMYRFLGGRTTKKEAYLDYIHHLRKTAYRAFIAWAHGCLRPPKGKTIPACVVNVVRASLPYPEELNKGFMKIYDYAASDMALD
eukprot:XP_012821535.1 PREDICTED: uncharacterized protein LOC100145450 isoform X7 [Xenopus tropicalis]